ncbi:low molecular weight phosphotyrosine protein phosphatase [Helcobacillus sp. ACRRO]|uniref:low molecular weight protein-tyrosine-phosphatase n=1 Tax=Helcobacillus TaxID=1161125 RepID=UPI0021A315C9|nr:low molecular weight protein-tyrosine-phosphatase [Helcobacillus massiliensis]MCG7426382.1 low molecular weight phosphotyrosine protein phosphatase [Helcobacillus sp. ACRRO]MCT2035484.1 low molecular weight phosphotyrosine protein phosphatase [Helcobacillus massiliensis]
MHLYFVCWGNICRSPMAERIAQECAREHLTASELEELSIESFGVSSEELGNPIDHRARVELRRHGIDADNHRARQITEHDVREADLIIAAEDFHLERLRALGAREDQIALVTDFVPGADAGDPLPDPWYGGAENFTSTMNVLNEAMPRIFAAVKERLQA